ncbi:hypothetical protein MG293_003860 [Ovis ammon polii]|uniref:Uncharacterized protein n=1 Tax=Ovis ammon polii TaxID=230172 RepID=A0AAD4UNI7_OVIAM|nr:hypothetical protein MG293_003860 [Ovis ammon polii]
MFTIAKLSCIMLNCTFLSWKCAVLLPRVGKNDEVKKQNFLKALDYTLNTKILKGLIHISVLFNLMFLNVMRVLYLVCYHFFTCKIQMLSLGISVLNWIILEQCERSLYILVEAARLKAAGKEYIKRKGKVGNSKCIKQCLQRQSYLRNRYFSVLNTLDGSLLPVFSSMIGSGPGKTGLQLPASGHFGILTAAQRSLERTSFMVRWNAMNVIAESWSSSPPGRGRLFLNRFWLILTEPPACVRGVEPAFAVGRNRRGRQGFDPPEECKATS